MHPDHVGGTKQFGNYYVHEADLNFINKAMCCSLACYVGGHRIGSREKHRKAKISRPVAIKDGYVFELGNRKRCSYHINTIAAHSEWIENREETDSGEKRREFRPVGYFEGKPRNIDTKLFNRDTGIYDGEPHDALVWPDADTDEKWKKEFVFLREEIPIQVRIRFIARGPKMAFCGHSFTGLWDSSYYYFRELAKMGGWNARVAYSYWGGTGIAHYAGQAMETGYARRCI